MAKRSVPPVDHRHASFVGGDVSASGDAPLFDERQFFAEQAPKRSSLNRATKPQTDDAKADIHFHGHRERLRTRFRDGGEAALAD
jgi:DNA repair protein RadC